MTVKLRAQIQSGVVSSALGLWTAFLTAAGLALTENALSTPQSSLAWFEAHWWGIVIGFAIGASTSAAHRVSQATARVDNTVDLGNGVTAVVTKPTSP